MTNERFKPYVAYQRTRSSTLGATERAVLTAATFRASGDGEVWASADCLAEDTGLSPRTVRRDLLRLEQLGVLVEVDRRPGRPTRWAIDVDAIPVRPTPAPRAAPPAPRAGVGQDRTPAPRAAPPAPRAAPPAPRADDPIQDPEIDPNPAPQPPPPAGVGELNLRARWVSDRALLDLAELEPSRAVEVLEQYAAGDGRLVSTWLALARPGAKRRRLPGAPSGLRAREVVAGLVAARARWLAGERPPPPPVDDSDRQLELPEPLPELDWPTAAAEVEAHPEQVSQPSGPTAAEALAAARARRAARGDVVQTVAAPTRPATPPRDPEVA